MKLVFSSGSRVLRAVLCASGLAALSSATALAAPVTPRPPVVAADACYPSCIENLYTACPLTAPCTQSQTATDPSTGSNTFAYCFANGVVGVIAENYVARTKPDGSLCYSQTTTMDASGAVYTTTWRDGSGNVVATETNDYSDSSHGNNHTVTCGGTSTVVNAVSATCLSEMETTQNPAGMSCTKTTTCMAPATTGGGGAGGSNGGSTGAGGAGGKGMGGAPAAGGSTATGGSSGAAGGAGGAPVTCPAGYVMCAGACVDYMSDSANCGECGNVCDPSYQCMQGACTMVTACLASQTLCGSTCVDATVDALNCGVCGHKCPAGDVCSNGVCGSSCADGSLMCGAACAPKNSPQTCGSCTTVCGATEVCCGQPLVGGTCPDQGLKFGPDEPYTCQSCLGWSVCDNQCTDLLNDSAHCGACTVVCQGLCDNGKCQQGSTSGDGCACAVADGSVGQTLLGLGVVALGLAMFLSRRRRGR